MTLPTAAAISPLYVPQWTTVRKMNTVMSTAKLCDSSLMRARHDILKNQKTIPKHRMNPLVIMLIS
jgi:hypothetical protein